MSNFFIVSDCWRQIDGYLVADSLEAAREKLVELLKEAGYEATSYSGGEIEGKKPEETRSFYVNEVGIFSAKEPRKYV